MDGGRNAVQTAELRPRRLRQTLQTQHNDHERVPLEESILLDVEHWNATSSQVGTHLLRPRLVSLTRIQIRPYFARSLNDTEVVLGNRGLLVSIIFFAPKIDDGTDRRAPARLAKRQTHLVFFCPLSRHYRTVSADLNNLQIICETTTSSTKT